MSAPIIKKLTKRSQYSEDLRVINGSEINFYVKKALKIPKILAEDKEFKLFFSPYREEFRDNNKTTPDCHIDIASLEQISFSVEDEELLKGTK